MSDDLKKNVVAKSDTKATYLSLYDPYRGVSNYLKMVNSIPRLSAEEEKRLAISFRDEGDLKSAQKLVESHLYLAAGIAFKYKNYSMPVEDLIGEANIGLMKAVRKFDIDKGFRLSTYAAFWIKAELHDYILGNWSLVKLDKSTANKTLFFNFNKKIKEAGINHDGLLSDDEIAKVAEYYSLKEDEIREIESRRNAGVESSLNYIVGSEDSGMEAMDLLESDVPNQAEMAERFNEMEFKKKILMEFLKTINEKEKEVVRARFMSEDPETLEVVGARLGISKERVRQIEVAIREKLQKFAKANFNYNKEG